MITLAAPLWRHRWLPLDELWIDILGFGVVTIFGLSLIFIVYCWLKDNEYI